MCSREIGLHIQSMLTILDSILNKLGGGCILLYEHENPHFDNE